MKFHVMTLFPEMIENGLGTSILGRAAEKGVISYEAVNIRDYTLDKHGKVDDYPYGGGAGMLIRAQPVYDAYQAITASFEQKPRTIYLTPQGRTFDQKMAAELAKEKELVFVCGHYEGIDERVLEKIVTDYVSIGDYVLTGGELPVMVMIDAIARLIPGVLHNDVSAETETFHNDLLEYPQYTRPEEWQGKKVPEVLLSGNSKKINEWRLEQSIEKTKLHRPDLYAKYEQKQEIIKRLSKKKRQNIHMMELLHRGLGEVVYDKGMDIVLKFENLYMLHAEDVVSARELLMKVPTGAMVITTQEFVRDLLEKEFGKTGFCKCSQAVCTRKEALTVRYKDIRQLDITYLEYILEHYTSSEEHMKECLNAGVMYGAFDEDRIIGFIGMHSEGSMGMLFVEEEYRKKGIGASLESYLINLQISNGFTPYCHIIEGNEKSMALQEKLGLYVADTPLWWIW
ncbi:MAG: tRNA (guanosine(37)-N1)-methyltransferase TrmD [Lachnospiraceae bacterium]|nr:tRNA (guanosine(37)-N1)-methyltransferase TrmD [Lachnospiraceae bacterium]